MKFKLFKYCCNLEFFKYFVIIFEFGVSDVLINFGIFNFFFIVFLVIKLVFNIIYGLEVLVYEVIVVIVIFFVFIVVLDLLLKLIFVFLLNLFWLSLCFWLLVGVVIDFLNFFFILFKKIKFCGCFGLESDVFIVDKFKLIIFVYLGFFFFILKNIWFCCKYFLINLICFLLWFVSFIYFNDFLFIGKKLYVVLYFGVMLVIVVLFVNGKCWIFGLKNLINFLIIFFLCNFLVICKVKFVVVEFCGKEWVKCILIILGIGKYDGCFNIFVLVLILLMF